MGLIDRGLPSNIIPGKRRKASIDFLGSEDPSVVFMRKVPRNYVKFVERYMAGENQAEICRSLGYKSPINQAEAIFRNPFVRAEIDRRKKLVMEATELNEAWIVKRLMRYADYDVRKLYNPDGTLKLPHELDEDIAATISAMRTTVNKSGARTMNVKVWDPLKALELLGRYMKMFSQEEDQGRGLIIKVIGGLPEVKPESTEPQAS